jgi:YD repeat-containing protein
LSRNDTAEGVTRYTYDAMDRLEDEVLTELACAVVQHNYTYDANGNTTSKTTSRNTVITDRVFYAWDFENRLVSADTDGNGTPDVQYQYDADGLRVSQSTQGQQTRFLLDKTLPYAQVVEEYTPGGILKVSCLHGLDLISQNRVGDTGKSFYHVDGLGSTRALTNSSGLVTRRDATVMSWIPHCGGPPLGCCQWNTRNPWPPNRRCRPLGSGPLWPTLHR